LDGFLPGSCRNLKARVLLFLLPKIHGWLNYDISGLCEISYQPIDLSIKSIISCIDFLANIRIQIHRNTIKEKTITIENFCGQRINLAYYPQNEAAEMNAPHIIYNAFTKSGIIEGTNALQILSYISYIKAMKNANNRKPLILSNTIPSTLVTSIRVNGELRLSLRSLLAELRDLLGGVSYFPGEDLLNPTEPDQIACMFSILPREVIQLIGKYCGEAVANL
jgi:hypothetical protein